MGELVPPPEPTRNFQVLGGRFVVGVIQEWVHSFHTSHHQGAVLSPIYSLLKVHFEVNISESGAFFASEVRGF